MKAITPQFLYLFLLLIAGTASATTHYVDLNSSNPTPPFTDWSTAATNIQDAIDASTDGDLVLVTNGVYQSSGRLVYGSSNCVALSKSGLTLQSVNGAAVTVIQGSPIMRCLYATNNTTVIGFTLSQGTARIFGSLMQESGGGIWCESTNCLILGCTVVSNTAWQLGGGVFSGTCSNSVIAYNNASVGGGGVCSNVVINCVLRSNSCTHGGGGGADGCVLYGCDISWNTDYDYAGGGPHNEGGGICKSAATSCTISNNTGSGAYVSQLTNCTIVGNSSDYEGGGAYFCNLNNCILIGNSTSPPSEGGGAFGGTLNNCTILYNWSKGGAGIEQAAATNCLILSNTAVFRGGGAYFSQLSGCTISWNSVTNGSGPSTPAGGGTYNSTLIFCTVTNNSSSGNGGGAYSGVLSNSIVEGNTAVSGGGVMSATAANCVIIGNSAITSGGVGGGACLGTLYNCDIIENSSYEGGGTWNGTAYNCIVYYNSASLGSNYYNGTLNSCCTAPLANGGGNITNDPAFVNPSGGDFHLQSTSPCINSGNNGYVTSPADLDGNPRIAGGTVDIGAYEYQTPTSVISYAWLQQYGLPTDGSVDFADLDGTTFNVYQDWIAGLDPTDPTSVLVLQSPQTTNSTGVTVTWSSVNNRTYYLQQATNLAAQPPFSTIQSNIVGQAGTTTFTDTTATNGGPYFYRVGVQH